MDDRWRMGELAGRRTLFVRMADLPPERRVWLVQAVRSSAGAQTGVPVTEETTAADGSLRCVLPLREIDPEETIGVLILDSSFRPLQEVWRPPDGKNG